MSSSSPGRAAMTAYGTKKKYAMISATPLERAIVSPRLARPRIRDSCATTMKVPMAAIETTLTRVGLTYQYS